MPNYKQYLTPDYTVGELNRIIGGQSDVSDKVRQNSNFIFIALNAGFEGGMFRKNEPGLEVSVSSGIRELSEDVRRISREMLDFGRQIGTDLSNDLANQHLSHLDLISVYEAIIGYVLGYFNPGAVEEYRRDNRSSKIAHLLPPEQNVN